MLATTSPSCRSFAVPVRPEQNCAGLPARIPAVKWASRRVDRPKAEVVACRSKVARQFGVFHPTSLTTSSRLENRRSLIAHSGVASQNPSFPNERVGFLITPTKPKKKSRIRYLRHSLLVRWRRGIRAAPRIKKCAAAGRGNDRKRSTIPDFAAVAESVLHRRPTPSGNGLVHAHANRDRNGANHQRHKQPNKNSPSSNRLSERSCFNRRSTKSDRGELPTLQSVRSPVRVDVQA